MARAPNEKAAEAEQLYRQGKKLVEIAELLGLPDGTVRRWKSSYGWDGERKANVRNKACVRNEPPPEVISVMENPALNDQQRLFCLYYSKSFNATRSYQKAYGCGYDVANAEGYKMLVNPCVREEITRLKAMRFGQAMLEPGDIFQKYMDIAFADVTDFVSFDQEDVPVMGAFGPVMVEDPVTGEKVTLTQKMNVVRTRPSDQVDGSLLAEVSQGKSGFKVKLLDQMKALQWLADHKDLATEEQRARIDKMRAETSKTKGPGDDEVEDDPITAALKEGTPDGVFG